MDQTLYSENFEHDACGIGAVVNIDGAASHSVVDDALTIVERLEHRAGKVRGGEDRLHGYRHSSGCAVRKAPALVQLLQAALCPGHKSAH